MITSVDTNVLLDVFVSHAPHHAQSVEWLRAAYDRGSLLVCDIVYAELVPAFGERVALNRALREIGITLSPINTDIAWEAGTRWMRYRRAAGPADRANASSPTSLSAPTPSPRLTPSLLETAASTPPTFQN